MSIILETDASMHYEDGSHRWTAPAEKDQAAWELRVQAHVAQHREHLDSGPSRMNPSRLQK